MGRKKNQSVWKHYDEQGKGVCCKYCKKFHATSNVNKMSKHLEKCFKCPFDVKKKLQPQSPEREKEGENSTFSGERSSMSRSPSPMTSSTSEISKSVDRMTNEENVCINKNMTIIWKNSHWLNGF